MPPTTDKSILPVLAPWQRISTCVSANESGALGAVMVTEVEDTHPLASVTTTE